LPPETYNGRFTALVNKCFPLNNIREKRDGAMLAVHYTPAHSSFSLDGLDAKPRAQGEIRFNLSWRTAFLRRVGTEGGNAVANLMVPLLDDVFE